MNIYDFYIDEDVRMDIRNNGYQRFIIDTYGKDGMPLDDAIFIMDKLIIYDSEEMFRALEESINIGIMNYIDEQYDLVHYCKCDIYCIKSFMSDLVNIGYDQSQWFKKEDMKDIKNYIRLKIGSLIEKYFHFMPGLINCSPDTSDYDEHARNLTDDIKFLTALMEAYKK